MKRLKCHYKKKLKRILRLPMREFKLPIEAKFGVYTAYVYYKKLLKKLENTPYHQIEMKSTGF
jgi:hypothetical protein